MKKTLSVLLAVLMMAVSLTPVFAADGTQHSITFRGPTELPAGSYSFVPSVNGMPEFENDDFGMNVVFDGDYKYIPLSYLKGTSKTIYSEAQKYVFDNSSKKYVADEKGTYVYLGNDALPLTDLTEEGITAFAAIFESGKVKFYDDFGNEDAPGRYVQSGQRYVYYTDIMFPDDRAEFWGYAISGDLHFLTPVTFENDTAMSYADGSVLTFHVMTNDVYDVSTVTVYVNGSLIERNQNGEYAVSVNRDLVITIAEFDANNNPVLLPNHYAVTLVSGEGYSVKPLKNENNKLVYHGGSYEFRVKLSKGYSAASMKVMVVRGSNDLAEYIGEDFDFLYTLNLDGKTETLTSTGVDEDGYRTYRIDNITTDCKVMVTGVQEESKVGIINMLKRILKFILDALGIHLGFLDDMMKTYEVTIDASSAPGITCEISSSGKTEGNINSLKVLSGESVTIKLTKKSETQGVTVRWEKDGQIVTNFGTPWTSHYNRYTGEYTYTASYYVDNITEDTHIVIISNN